MWNLEKGEARVRRERTVQWRLTVFINLHSWSCAFIAETIPIMFKNRKYSSANSEIRIKSPVKSDLVTDKFICKSVFLFIS